MSKKQIGLIVKFPPEQCSEKECDYMRAKYICKLLEWKKVELLKEEQKAV